MGSGAVHMGLSENPWRKQQRRELFFWNSESRRSDPGRKMITSSFLRGRDMHARLEMHVNG